MDDNDGSTQVQIPAPKVRRGILALLSALCGLAFCAPPLPFLTPFLGFAALRSRKPQIGGRAAAWTGIVLSIPSSIFAGWYLYIYYGLSAPAGEFAKAFITDLSSGNRTAAAIKCDSDVSPAELDKWTIAVAKLGTPLRVECGPVVYNGAFKGEDRRFAYTIVATVTDPSGATESFDFALFRSDGAFRVWTFSPESPGKAKQ